MRSSENSDWYTVTVLDDATFRRHADAALESLRKALIQAENEAEFEVEEQNGALAITFEAPPSTFTLTPRSAVRQIWLESVSNTLQLDWDEQTQTFMLAKTGERLKPLVVRLMREHLGGSEIVLP